MLTLLSTFLTNSETVEDIIGLCGLAILNKSCEVPSFSLKFVFLSTYSSNTWTTYKDLSCGNTWYVIKGSACRLSKWNIYWSPDLPMNVKFRFAIAETFNVFVKASNTVVKLYVSYFKERLLLTPQLDLINFSTTSACQIKLYRGWGGFWKCRNTWVLSSLLLGCH